MKKIVASMVIVLLAWGISFSTASASAPGFHHPSDWDKNSILRKDARGVEVKNMQYIINVLRFYTDSSVIDSDGIFGPKTEAAVKKYQKTHDLMVDGVVGPRTWDSFSQYIEKRGTNTYGAGGYMALRIHWKYDSSNFYAPSKAYIYGNGDTLTDSYRLYAN
ncbi:peptidoglycan-binding domain-containing protein [Fictibacillus enclensis]|uniref:peptidoglycan-binding domain-containing protein n=1 Tax=Fictibacillus enclensis TaxID=1017270 RepID=UPI0025A0FEE5|nr:peptidoglycan-binding domain-containing protein [Fictibacillus enclensis]MDM5198018.1 peptidoglycan-binding domain-containing protein [Fictibacillus enclensis]